MWITQERYEDVCQVPYLYNCNRRICLDKNCWEKRWLREKYQQKDPEINKQTAETLDMRESINNW